MGLTGQLLPDHKTIARFRKDNGPAIRAVCRPFVGLCRKLNLFSQAVVAVDGSKFKLLPNLCAQRSVCARQGAPGQTLGA
jgi:transposase